jgi:hypothetical protein
LATVSGSTSNSRVFGKTKFVNRFNVIQLFGPLQARFLFTKNGKYAYLAPSRLGKRGGRVVTDVEAGSDGRELHRLTSDVARGRRKRVVLAPLGWC